VLIFTSARGLQRGEPVTWCIRPNQVEIGQNGTLPATVTDAVDLPTVREATVQLAPNLELIVHDPTPPLRPGDGCYLRLPPEAVLVWSGAAAAVEPEAAALAAR
jgi:hypothetical protein